jgi:hypothetical protein
LRIDVYHLAFHREIRIIFQESTPAAEASTYISMLQTIQSNRHDISVVMYTQISDVELEVGYFYSFIL